MAIVNLGDEVMDPVSGFKGIATSRMECLNGCTRIGVQPKVGDDGKMLDAYWIDEPQLKVTKAKAVPRGPVNTGGPNTKVPSQSMPK